MNALLQTRYNELGKEEVLLLRKRLSDSPRALLLFDFLEKRKGKKINAMDAVGFIYKDGNEKFEVLRNRFFKLRKQIIELIDESGKNSPANGMMLLPLEDKLYRCRQMISENHFQLAKNELRQLIDECRESNIFEILPEAIGQLIYCNMAMNVLKENEKLLSELNEASSLLNDMRQMQVLSRKIYMDVISRNYDSLPELIRKIRRLALARSDFRRFRIFYHFTVLGYTVGVPSFSSKAHARHLSSLKKLMEQNPGMPIGYYEPNGAAIMQFYLLTAEGTHLYMKGDVANAYNLFKDAWEIMERTPNLRIRKSESFFSNRIAIEVATGRFREALKTAEGLIEFQKEQRQEEKRLKGFADMAMIYTYSYPSLKCPNPDFLISQLKTYVSLLKKNDSSLLGDGLSTQAIFYFLCGDFKSVKKIMANEKAKAIFLKMNLKIYIDLLDLSTDSSAEKVNEVKLEIDRQMNRSVSSDIVYSLKRAKILMKFLEDKRKVK